jgi:Rrf2 family protein
VMFSQSTQYAIAALAYLAEQPSDEVCGAHQIATAINTPLPYLWKVLRALAENGLVISCKGCAGGYRLARDSRKISLNDILLAMSEGATLSGCILTHWECDAKRPCHLHRPWDVFRKRLEKTTVADLRRQNCDR